VLEGWRLGGLADDVVSCVSELVANVYEHAAKSATAELFVSWVPGYSLTVEVRDQDSGCRAAARPPSWGCCLWH